MNLTREYVQIGTYIILHLGKLLLRSLKDIPILLSTQTFRLWLLIDHISPSRAAHLWRSFWHLSGRL